MGGRSNFIFIYSFIIILLLKSFYFYVWLSNKQHICSLVACNHFKKDSDNIASVWSKVFPTQYRMGEFLFAVIPLRPSIISFVPRATHRRRLTNQTEERMNAVNVRKLCIMTNNQNQYYYENTRKYQQYLVYIKGSLQNDASFVNNILLCFRIILCLYNKIHDELLICAWIIIIFFGRA